MTTITNAMLNHYNQLAACAEAETLQECIARAEAAEAEVARLSEARRLLSEVYNAFGYTWPQYYVEDVGAFLEQTRQDGG